MVARPGRGTRLQLPTSKRKKKGDVEEGYGSQSGGGEGGQSKKDVHSVGELFRFLLVDCAAATAVHKSNVAAMAITVRTMLSSQQPSLSFQAHPMSAARTQSLYWIQNDANSSHSSFIVRFCQALAC